MDPFYIVMFIVWPIILVTAVLIEFSTLEQIGTAGAVASIPAMIVHATSGKDNYWIEFLVFGITWVVSWIILFVLFKKYKDKIKDKDDGYLKFIGQVTLCLKSNETAEEHGLIELENKTFNFKCDSIVKEGEKVKVLSIRGNTIYVEKVGK